MEHKQIVVIQHVLGHPVVNFRALPFDFGIYIMQVQFMRIKVLMTLQNVFVTEKKVFCYSSILEDCRTG